MDSAECSVSDVVGWLLAPVTLQWIDRIRSTRASNEARQLAFIKLSGELQRKAGLKGAELGGNAILG